ncbi:hypothetical protein DIPPA_30786 [Diplonema papillatum]|nr:hypothetical protein DIPPA_30786 [Diplonema papillatum]
MQASHIPSLPKATNPLALLKAAQKKRELEKKRKADAASAPPATAAAPAAPPAKAAAAAEPAAAPQPKAAVFARAEIKAPAELPTAVIRADTPIVTPQYCKQRPDMAVSARVRPGVPLTKPVREKLAEGELACDNDFLRDLVADRMVAIAGQELRVADLSASRGRSWAQLNMENDVASACVEMIERFDFTYGGVATAADLIEAAQGVHCLSAIETLAGNDVVSHAFCLVYTMFLLRFSRTKLIAMLKSDNPYVRGLALIFLRYTATPTQFAKDVKQGAASSGPGSVCVADEADGAEEKSYKEFVDLLCEQEPEFLETAFPAWTREEAEYVSRVVSQERVIASMAAATGPPKKQYSKEEVREMRVKRRAEGRAAADELRKKTKYATLLDGFRDAGTQMAWVSYRAAAQNQTSDSVAARYEAQRLQDEIAKFEALQKEAEERAEEGPQAITQIEVTDDRWPKQIAVAKSKSERAAKRRAEAAEQLLRKKAKTAAHSKEEDQA